MRHTLYKGQFEIVNTNNNVRRASKRPCPLIFFAGCRFQKFLFKQLNQSNNNST